METISLPSVEVQNQPTPGYAYKNVILINKATSLRNDISNQQIKVERSNQFSFSGLINDLKQSHPQLSRAFFFMWLNDKEYLIGADPFENERFITIENLEGTSDIIILYTESKNNKKKDSMQISIGPTSEQQISNDENSQKQESAQQTQKSQEEMFVLNQNDEFEKVQQCLKPREKRVKERTIEYVIDKVKKWRDIYENGIKNEKGEIVKPNLDVSAQLVYLSRKTLDDYYAQLRKGEMYGFDFQKNKHEKMGTLRKYVKEQQKNNPNQKNKGKLVGFDSEELNQYQQNVKIEEEQEQEQEQEEEEGSNQQQIIYPTQELKNDFQTKFDFCTDNFNFSEQDDNQLQQCNAQIQQSVPLKDMLNNSQYQIKFEDNSNNDFPLIGLQQTISVNRGKDVCDIFMNLEDQNQDYVQSLFQDNNMEED